jgi:hypothetical protein
VQCLCTVTVVWYCIVFSFSNNASQKNYGNHCNKDFSVQLTEFIVNEPFELF